MLLRRWIWLVDIMSVQCLTSKLYIISYLGLLWCKFDGIVYFICALQTLKTSGLATILHFLFSSLSGCVVNRHLILCMLTVFFITCVIVYVVFVVSTFNVLTLLVGWQSGPTASTVCKAFPTLTTSTWWHMYTRKMDINNKNNNINSNNKKTVICNAHNVSILQLNRRRAVIITHPESWYLCYRPREGRRPSQPSWLVWFAHPRIVTHHSTSRVWRRATTLIKANGQREAKIVCACATVCVILYCYC